MYLPSKQVMGINTVLVQEYKWQNSSVCRLKTGMCIKASSDTEAPETPLVSKGYWRPQFQTYQCVYYKEDIATASWFVYQRLIIIQHIYVSYARVFLVHEILRDLITGKRVESNLSTESQP